MSGYLTRELDEADNGPIGPTGSGVEAPPFLADLLGSIAGEVEALMIKRGTNVRALAMCLTKIQEAKMWAVEHGQDTGAHVVIDRRAYATNGGPHSEPATY